MSAANLKNNTIDEAQFTNVPLAPNDDKVPSNKDVVFSCNICDKSYHIKSSFQSHMRLKHKPNKESDMEKGTKTTNKKKEEMFYSWVENEKDDRPLMLTRDLDSFLDNRSDSSLVAAAEGGIEVGIQMEKLMVKDHELEWFDEDSASFMGQFTILILPAPFEESHCNLKRKMINWQSCTMI